MATPQSTGSVAAADPLVHRRRLGTELRKARAEAKRTQREVAEALDWSVSKIIRIEQGVVGVSGTDLRALLQHYGITDKQRADGLVAQAREGKKRAWWSSYKDDLDEEFRAYLAYESSASILRQFHPLLIPGQLQTEDYARAVLAAYGDSEKVDTLLEVRLERQELLERPDHPEMFFIVDEAAIRRWVGGPAVMRAQLRKLRDFAQRPRITVQVLPFTLGAHAGMKGPFVILEFPDPDDELVVFLENPRGDLISRDKPEETAAYLETFWRLETDATPKEKVSEVLDDAIGQLRPPGESTSATEADDRGGGRSVRKR
jgi:transcriptional regulator with XRE-family HTH domain